VTVFSGSNKIPGRGMWKFFSSPRIHNGPGTHRAFYKTDTRIVTLICSPVRNAEIKMLYFIARCWVTFSLYFCKRKI